MHGGEPEPTIDRRAAFASPRYRAWIRIAPGWPPSRAGGAEARPGPATVTKWSGAGVLLSADQGPDRSDIGTVNLTGQVYQRPTG
ncbi:hypothetical protein F0L68_33510 [Solihabitans fulvus]|uniref:Uncharacterized protein n=1 Tax=Solihabitans fulvus TaxID=1892852 RepID=A0A5B2WQT0_9PSEU|nr:hypothetical protein F0L68_33510 [Solihabitans fulvus]